MSITHDYERCAVNFEFIVKRTGVRVAPASCTAAEARESRALTESPPAHGARAVRTASPVGSHGIGAWVGNCESRSPGLVLFCDDDRWILFTERQRAKT